MTPAEQHAAVLDAAAKRYYQAVYDHCHDSPEALGLDGRRRILERHAPVMTVPYGSGLSPMAQCGACAALCHSSSGLRCEEPIDGPWPCEDYRDAAAGLLPEAV